MNLFYPQIAYASVDDFILKVNGQIINPLIIFLFALAVVLFLYGLVEFIGNGANDEKKTTGKSHMIWGVVGLTIMMGVWFILGVILRTFDLDKDIDPQKGTVKLNDYNPTFPSPKSN
jgi:uncharacterized membrane protein YidH (DUF202 family)